MKIILVQISIMILFVNLNGCSKGASTSHGSATGVALSPHDDSYDAVETSDGGWIQFGSSYSVIGTTACGSKTALQTSMVKMTSNGALDTSFGTGGKIKTNISGSHSEKINAAAIQPDGKILVGGYLEPEWTEYSDCFDSKFYQLFVARLNSNGSVDTSFGTNGFFIVDHSTGTGATVITDLVILNSGKIMASGWQYDTKFRGFIYQLNSNGTLDTHFGSGGLADTTSLTDINASLGFGFETDFVHTVVQSDGKLVIAIRGGFSSTLKTKIILVRFNSTGTIDTSFNGVGYIGIDPNGTFTVAGLGVTMLQSGKILTSWGCYPSGAVETQVCLSRVNSDGTLDTSFGTSGSTTITSTTTNVFYYGTNAVELGDGSLIVAGSYNGPWTQNSSDTTLNEGWALAKLTSAGALDTTFGVQGISRINFFLNTGSTAAGSAHDETASTSATRLKYSSSGKLVVIGSILYSRDKSGKELYNASRNDFAITVTNVDGSPNTAFNGTGFRLTDFTGGY